MMIFSPRFGNLETKDTGSYLRLVVVRSQVVLQSKSVVVIFGEGREIKLGGYWLTRLRPLPPPPLLQHHRHPLQKKM